MSFPYHLLMSFPFHNQTEPRPHWDNDLPSSPLCNKCESMTSPLCNISLCFPASAQFHSEGCLPHRAPSYVSSPSWEMWLPGSWLLLCGLTGLVWRYLNLEMWNCSWQNLAEMVTIPHKVSINWYFLRITLLPAHKDIKYQKIWLLTKLELCQWALDQVKHNCRQLSSSTLCHWLCINLFVLFPQLFHDGQTYLLLNSKPWDFTDQPARVPATDWEYQRTSSDAPGMERTGRGHQFATASVPEDHVLQLLYSITADPVLPHLWGIWENAN